MVKVKVRLIKTYPKNDKESYNIAQSELEIKMIASWNVNLRRTWGNKSRTWESQKQVKAQMRDKSERRSAQPSKEE